VAYRTKRFPCTFMFQRLGWRDTRTGTGTWMASLPQSPRVVSLCRGGGRTPAMWANACMRLECNRSGCTHVHGCGVLRPAHSTYGVRTCNALVPCYVTAEIVRWCSATAKQFDKLGNAARMICFSKDEARVVGAAEKTDLTKGRPPAGRCRRWSNHRGQSVPPIARQSILQRLCRSSLDDRARMKRCAHVARAFVGATRQHVVVFGRTECASQHAVSALLERSLAR
jgi:hypothetical protein